VLQDPDPDADPPPPLSATNRNSQEADYPGTSAIPLRLPNEEPKNRQHKLIDKHVQF